MRKWTAIVLMAVGMSMLAVGAQADCGKCEHKQDWCAKCGETDKEKCCKEAEKCGKCGLHKGTPGCKAKCAKNEK